MATPEESRERGAEHPEDLGWGGPPEQNRHRPGHRWGPGGVRLEPAEGLAPRRHLARARTVEARCPSCGYRFPVEVEGSSGERPRHDVIHRSDGQMKAEIELALKEEGGLAVDSIEVEVSDGVVRLAGNVPDLEAKRRSGEVAYRTPGVKEVRNALALGD